MNLLHINTLACVRAKIYPMLRNLHFSHIVQNHSGIIFTHTLIMNTKRTQLLKEHNCIILTSCQVPKLRYRVHKNLDVACQCVLATR